MKGPIGLLFGAVILGMVAAGTARAEDCRAPVTMKEALAAEDARYQPVVKGDTGCETRRGDSARGTDPKKLAGFLRVSDRRSEFSFTRRPCTRFATAC